MTSSPAASFLDQPIARVCALLCFLLCVAVLAYIHRGDLGAAMAGRRDPVARCLADRADDIDQMMKEGGISEHQAQLFKERAEVLCRNQLGG